MDQIKKNDHDNLGKKNFYQKGKNDAAKFSYN
jgi:hypothetical protein